MMSVQACLADTISVIIKGGRSFTLVFRYTKIVDWLNFNVSPVCSQEETCDDFRYISLKDVSARG